MFAILTTEHEDTYPSYSLINLQITQEDAGGAHKVISCQVTVIYLC